MIRTKGEAGTGNVVEAVRHMRAVHAGIRHLSGLRRDELYAEAKRRGIRGRSKMTKAQLQAALEKGA